MTTWNTIEKGSTIVLSEGDLKASGIYQSSSVKSTTTKSNGKWFCEIKIDKDNFTAIGIGEPSLTMKGAITASTNFFYYSYNGIKKNGANYSAYGSTFTSGDVIGMLVDFDLGELTFYKNGTNLGVAFNNIKSLNEFCVIATGGSSDGSGIVTANFGASPFKSPPSKLSLPKGVKSLDGSQALSNVDKTLILQDGKYKKFIPKTLGKDSTVNVVPNMTSDTSPIGKATARGAYDPAWKAFDRNDSTYWYDNGSSAGAPSWLQYQFDTPKIVNKITLSSLPISGSTYGLKEFSFLGSYDGFSYDNLLTVDNHPNNNAKVTYVFNNSKEYLFYKLQFGLSYYSYYTLVNSFEMYEIDTPDTPAYWSTISNNIPSSTQFLDRGMDNLSPLFDRTITKLEPLSMTNKSELLQTGEIGKTFSKVIDLKKYFDIRSIRTEVK